MPNKLVISGFGWLAGYLAARVKETCSVVGTTRTIEKIAAMHAQGIEGIQFALGDNTNVLTKHLNGATLLLNIPPGRHSTNLDKFTTNMLKLIDDSVAANVSRIVFVSTTSVYGDATNDTIYEDTQTSPETASAKAHVAIERHLLALADNVEIVIVRLAGLVGPDRHPAKSLSGRNISAGNKRVNLVHITDVVEALNTLVNSPAPPKLLHLCSAQHPKRGEYYVKAAQSFGIPEPIFTDTQLASCGKVINANKSWASLGISPVYADPVSMY